MRATEPTWDLVTGGAGFLGSHMVEYLLGQGRHVLVLDNMDAGSRRNVPPPSSSLEVIEGDTRGVDWWPQVFARRVERVFHFAANASVPRSSDEPELDLTTNVLGTLRMLLFAVRHQALFINISSAAVYGTPDRVPTDETHPTVPISPYGVSKLSAEHYVDLFRREYGLDTRTIRYFNCYGPRQPRYIVFDFFKKALADDPLFEVLGSGEQIRTQLYAADAVKATILVAESGDHKPYNIGSDVSFCVTDLAHEVLGVVGRKGRQIVTTGKSWPGDIFTLVPDITRVRRLGFDPAVTLNEGLANVMSWWREQRE